MVAIDVVSWLAPALQKHRYLEEEGGAEEEPEQVFGWDKNGFNTSEHVMAAEYLLVFVLLLITTFILQHYVGKVWHLIYLPEAGATILLGMFISIFIRASGKDTTTGAISVLGFDSTLFMLGFLPPIIYNAGYSLKRRLFFANMGGILLLALVGTVLSAFVVATGIYAFGKAGAAADITYMEGLCFGSLISATDPVSTLAIFVELKVDPTLFYLVFGESVINDAIAITLFKTTSKFVGHDIGVADVFIAIIDFFVIFIGSAVIGYIFGLVSAWMFKTINLSHHRLVLVSIFVANVYVPFLFAETMQLSGVVAILFTAITTRRYVSQNIPVEAKRAAAFVFELLAFMSETAVFLFLGLSVFSIGASGGYNIGTIMFTWIFCQLGRAMHVYPLLEWVNRYREKQAVIKNRRPNLIPMRTKHMVFFSGLRGAVAYALANIFPDNLGNRSLFVATTMVMVLITIFINGGLTVKMLDYLGIDKDVNFSEFVDQLKKFARMHKFLAFEKKYVYPLVIKGHSAEDEVDLSSKGGSEHHLGSEHDEHERGDEKISAQVAMHETHVVDGQALEFERNPMYGAVMAGGHLSVSADDTIDDPEAPRHTSANRTTVTAPYGDSESLW